jgi:hypothetical protein
MSFSTHLYRVNAKYCVGCDGKPNVMAEKTAQF